MNAVHPANGGTDQVAMPAELIRVLLRYALESYEFDETQYQRYTRFVALW